MGGRIISIGRQFGSGGHETGMEVAKRLGIPCYDKELIALAASRGELNGGKLEHYDEKQENPWLYEAVYGGNRHVPKGSSFFTVLFKLQSDVIRAIAQREDAVIIGRCADEILREAPQVKLLTVFIHAPFDHRVRRKMELEHLKLRQAVSLVRRTDQQRGRYYQSHTGRKWGSPEHFQLYLDSSKYTIDQMAEMIAAEYESLGE